MTQSELISFLQTKNASLFPKASDVDIISTNNVLQQIRASMLPKFLIDLYSQTSGITLGSACIFGPTEINRGLKYPLPAISDINANIVSNKNMFGKTLFGRNDLFWFATDALGTCYMLDNLTLSVLRKYDEPYKAILDCLIIGKI
ncbi:MAG: hypothetical protein MJ156_00805 [Alphaproteobacteria bacterium]|nr:hypothetical protein [Alphaproteobacteria bacterium]